MSDTDITEARANLAEKEAAKTILGIVSGRAPGVINGARFFPKKDTSKPCKRPGKGKLGKHQAFLSRRRTAHSATISQVKQPLAYRAPGSMKGR